MKKSLLTLCLAVACTAATAKPYPAHDMGQVLASNHIDISAADKIYDDLGEHAGMSHPNSTMLTTRHKRQRKYAP